MCFWFGICFNLVANQDSHIRYQISVRWRVLKGFVWNERVCFLLFRQSAILSFFGVLAWRDVTTRCVFNMKTLFYILTKDSFLYIFLWFFDQRLFLFSSFFSDILLLTYLENETVLIFFLVTSLLRFVLTFSYVFLWFSSQNKKKSFKKKIRRLSSKTSFDHQEAVWISSENNIENSGKSWCFDLFFHRKIIFLNLAGDISDEKPKKSCSTSTKRIRLFLMRLKLDRTVLVICLQCQQKKREVKGEMLI